MAAVVRRLIKERGGKQVVVYVPDYFCNQSLSWMRGENCKIIFYPVTLECKPDWEKVDELVKNDHPPDLFILVHYFGFCNDIENAVDFCEKHGAKLLEDAAHALRPTSQIGNRGWATLFSPHKLLPFPPVGILTYKENVEDYFSAPPLGSFCKKSDIVWFLKRSLQSFLTDANINYKSFKSMPEFDYNGEDEAENNLSGSYETVSKTTIRWVLSLKDSLNDIAKKRKANYQKLEHVLSRFNNVKPAFDNDKNETIPYLFAFRSEEKTAYDIFKQLRLRRVPVQTWPDIAPEVLKKPENHCAALTLRKTILTLPIHQDVSNQQIAYMGDVLSDLLSTANSSGVINNNFAGRFKKNSKHGNAPCLERVERVKWNELSKKCNRFNMMQSWEYGDAKRLSQRWRPQRFALLDENAEPFGVLQALTISLPLIGGAVRINRGPLLFDDIWGANDCEETIEKAIQAVACGIKKRRWRYLNISFEFPENIKTAEALKKYGFRQKGGSAWGSTLLSLEKSVEEIRASFHGKWRNLLKKAEKSELELEHAEADDDLNFLINNYLQLQQDKNFSGIPEKLFRTMGSVTGGSWDFCPIFALKNQERVGGVLFVGHGDTSTYMVGWTSLEGRDLMANYFLLWQAILYFKGLGYKWFDVGGLNEDTPKGIAHFKQGLKGAPYRLVGNWAKY